MIFVAILLLIFVLIIPVIKDLEFENKRQRRRSYYREEYLKSNTWKRKRYVVLKRDNWRCVYCGGRATQVHHKRYAKKILGRNQ